MTREEAIDVLKTETCYECTYGCMSTADCENEKCPFRKAVLMAIESLEQEPILDKIMAEIEQMPSELTADGRRMIRRGSVFRIIEKYKAGGTI